MKFRHVTKLAVGLDLEGSKRPLGTLAWSSKERRAYFEYDRQFLANPLPISPFYLKSQPGLVAADYQPFEGLHGLFNDSLPDGWGRLLLDRRLERAGVHYQGLTPLDRLAAIGTTGMGALTYMPEFLDNNGTDKDLDWFVEQVERVEHAMDTADVDGLQGAQGGSAGARPKIMIGLNADRTGFVIDYGQELKPGFERWIVKARGAGDGAEIGVEEHAYALMARAAGLRMADTAILTTRKGHRLFAARRFDRTQSGRLHVHTASGLLKASHREPSIDYEMLHRLTMQITRDRNEMVEMFGRMTFNVLARNRDDHAKNHAFLMEKTGTWVLSPAYDLTFSSGPAGEHSLAIAGEGRNPGEIHLLAIAKDASIPHAEAKVIIDRVRAAIERWPDYANKAGLSAQRTNELNRAINRHTAAVASKESGRSGPPIRSDRRASRGRRGSEPESSGPSP